MKKVLRFFYSMKFALILLVVLALACTVGSVIPQGNIVAYYTENYSTQIAGAIMLFGLDDIFHCGWFVVLTVLLCLNLTFCNLQHFPSLIRRTKSGFTAEKCMKSWDGTAVAFAQEPKEVLTKSGFRNIQSFTDASGRAGLYAVKNRAGIWGAWLTHLGLLIIIIGFGMGQVMMQEYTVYGVPGQTKAIGDTGYDLTIDDFNIGLREDETVDQYTSTLTMTDTKTGDSKQGQTSVNNPLSLFGMKLYQNSTGWAATLKVSKDGEVIQETQICAGEYAPLEEYPEVVVMLSAFYPDYVRAQDGTPMTASSTLKNPGYLYMLYYKGEMLGMNVLSGDEKITLEGYEIVFSDPQSYTLIQIKKDPFTWVAMIGGVIIMVALILAFYLRTAEAWAVQQEDGNWAIAGRSRKGSTDFLDELKRNASR